jgi:hypothetical protein
MRINPKIITAPNGRKYACFFDAGYAYAWFESQYPQAKPQAAVRIGNMAGFCINP